MTDREGKKFYIECGGCGSFHEPGFHGDCRDDEHRFTYDQLDELHGENGWDYLEIEEQMRLYEEAENEAEESGFQP